MKNVKTIIQKVVAVLIAFVIIMSQYVITGLIEVTYAIDLLATQSNNVQFRAYFKNGEEELTEIEKSIDAKDLKLKIDVAVKNEGYFNGQISLENAGFKLTQETANNYINRVENNVIYLNKINAEETASIEIGIEYLGEDKVSVSTLSGETTVKLTGRYTGSGGNVEINSGSQVKVIWKIPEGTKAELTAKIQTNNIYRIEEQNKKIVQFLISSELTNNGYPIKSTEITATKPEGATKVEVHKRTTKSTNGEQEFVEADNVRQEGNNVIIKVENNEVEGKVSWLKGVDDIFVVTYEYPEDKELSAENIIINNKITTYDKDKTTGNNIELNGEQVQLQLNETKDGIASVIKQEKETQIYKGKIYSGEEREITSYTLAYVDYVEGIASLEITEKEAKYAKEVEENGTTNLVDVDANVEIKSLKVNKEEVAKVLGNTWSLTVGETEINNNTPNSDEGGNIVLTLPEGTKTVNIQTSKPQNNGFFVIETKKAIKNTSNTREEKKEFTVLKDTCSMNYIANNDQFTLPPFTYKIGLKDTESKATLQSEQQALMASEETKPLNLKVVLESNGENRDLYKNPVIKIKLPNQIESVTFAQRPQIMYGNDELTITDGNYTVTEENGQKVINIRLTGEQTRYLGEAVEGVTVLIKTNVKVKDNAADSEEEIVLNYTNENATKYADNGTQKVNVQIMANANQNQGQEQNQGEGQNQGNQNNNQQNNESNLSMELTAKVGGETINEGDAVRAGEIIVYTVKVTNEGNTNKTGLSIETTIPEHTTLVERNPMYPKERHYTDEEIDAGVNEDYFVEKTERIVRKDNININAGKSVEFKYLVRGNNDITQDTNIELIAKLKDGDNEKIVNLQNELSKSNLSIELKPKTRTGEDAVKAGYGYVYIANIKNLSNVEQSNVKVTINKNDLIDVRSIGYITNDYPEQIQVNEMEFTIDSINPNGNVYMEISAYIKPDTDELKNANMFIIATDSSGVSNRSNILSEPIESVKIDATLTQKSGNNTSGNVKSGDNITYEIKLKNVGEKNTENLSIKDRISKYVDIQSVLLNGNSCEYVDGIEQDDEGNTYKIVTINNPLNIGEELTIKIDCIVKSDINETGRLDIINQAFISDSVNITETDQKVFYLDNNSSGNGQDDGNDNGSGGNNQNENGNEQNDGSNGNNGNGQNNNSNNSINNYTISGVAWKDSNKNGSRDQNEELLQGINVYAINTSNNIVKDENGNKIISTTNESGEYSLTILEKGNYLIVFEYDTEIYNTTEYRKEGISDNKNSDAIEVSKVIEGTEKKVAITDTLNIESNYSNVDLGLVENQNEKVQIKKTVNSIMVTNKEGTKKYNYNNTDLAKVEIASKSLSGSIVTIEYSIIVKNTGSSEMYVKNIIDYLPSSLTFTSTMNKDWYKKNNYLYNSSLSKKPIKAGEIKEFKLILTKKMTTSNTGLVNNKATMEAIYNKDGTGVSSNQTSSADVIISVKTGEITIYALFGLMIVALAIGIAYIVRKTIIKEERR